MGRQDTVVSRCISGSLWNSKNWMLQKKLVSSPEAGFFVQNNSVGSSFSALACPFSGTYEEVQKRTAEYPPALRDALKRNGTRNTHRRGVSISNILEGIAGRSNNE